MPERAARPVSPLSWVLAGLGLLLLLAAGGLAWWLAGDQTALVAWLGVGTAGLIGLVLLVVGLVRLVGRRLAPGLARPPVPAPAPTIGSAPTTGAPPAAAADPSCPDPPLIFQPAVAADQARGLGWRRASDLVPPAGEKASDR